LKEVTGFSTLLKFPASKIIFYRAIHQGLTTLYFPKLFYAATRPTYSRNPTPDCQIHRSGHTLCSSPTVLVYWKIGRTIFEEKQGAKDRAGYGAYLIKQLSAELEPLLWLGFFTPPTGASTSY
jgi:hypothetical protein